MSAQEKGFSLDLGGGFTEDAPRPPVPGEEGDLVSADPRTGGLGFSAGKGDGGKAETTTATPRRPDLDLGYEPEGSASPTPPYLRWAESLHSLLDDQDGIHLFRTFLKHESCADLLDFWFACSGFRKLAPCDSKEEKRLKLAKAIYKKYILDNNGIVSQQVKPATKSFIKDCVLKQLIDPAMFDQAQMEIQSMIEENTYPLFLKSDIYLEYTRTGGESPKLHSDQSSGSGTGKALPGYLPTLNEDEEWKCDQDIMEEEERQVATDLESASSSRFTQKLLLETTTHPAPRTRHYSEGREFRPGPWRETGHPYYVNTGYALAPATSANDSEQHSMSSDADTMSLTDSSLDGVPPYRLRKQHRREMQESAKANGHVPLPHIPRTYRMPKDIHVEPQKFAAELINRLKEVLRDREAEAKLEERLKRVRAEEEGEDADLPLGPSLMNHKLVPTQLLPHFAPRYAELQVHDAHEENPESILDEHVQRVMKTPGCQSPKPRSPDSGLVSKLHGLAGSVPLGHSKHASKSGLKLETANLYHHKHVYHHVVHHHAGLKAKETLEEAAGQRMQGPFAWSVDPHSCTTKSRAYGESLGLAPGPLDAMTYSAKTGLLSKRSAKKSDPGKNEGASCDVPGSPEDLERNQKIMQWIIEGEKEISRHRKTTHSSSGTKKQLAHDPPRPVPIDRPMAVHPWVSFRNVVQPSHPFIQDPTMPPNPAPNPLTQLEEARRRLEEEEKRISKPAAKQRMKATKRLGFSQPCENIVVAYYFCGEPIPYRTLVKGRVVTLGQFKELLTKKGNYRYYFKKVSDEFDCGVVFEEVQEEEAVLPIFEEKIIGKGCRCDGGCTVASCPCILRSQCSWTLTGGQLSLDTTGTAPEVGSIYECSMLCACPRSCPNRVVQRGLRTQLQLYRTAAKGWGVRTVQDVPCGVFLCQYFGELISNTEAAHREEDTYYFVVDMQDGQQCCLDGRYYGNVGRFLNHSCQPNLVALQVALGYEIPGIAFFSTRAIQAGEELGFDYGDQFWEVKSWNCTCLCGSPGCRRLARSPTRLPSPAAGDPCPPRPPLRGFALKSKRSSPLKRATRSRLARESRPP